MISAPIVPVELKIVGILNRMGRHKMQNKDVSLSDLLSDSTSLPDMIAIFLGVLELVKMRQILIVDDPDEKREPPIFKSGVNNFLTNSNRFRPICSPNRKLTNCFIFYRIYLHL